MRNRNNSHNNNNNRRGQNPMTRVFESNGPDIKIRGTASHVAEKYVQLARDARSSGDPVAAENYYQHAEHYFRLIAAAQEQFRQNQPQPRIDLDNAGDRRRRRRGRELLAFRPGAGLRAPQQQQPFMRDNNPREQRGDGQPYQRDQQPREHRERDREREHRPQPQYQPQPQPQPVIADTGGVDRLPSFITGRSRRSMARPAVMKAVAAANVSRAGAAGRMARVPRAWPHLPPRAKISIRGMNSVATRYLWSSTRKRARLSYASPDETRATRQALPS